MKFLVDCGIPGSNSGLEMQSACVLNEGSEYHSKTGK